MITALAVAVMLALGPLPAVDAPLPDGTAPRVPATGLQAPQACEDSGGAPGPRVPDTQVAALGLDAAHRLATGRGVRVAVIDTGIAPHPRLDGRVTGVGDYVRGGSGLEDCDGHGTAVAGLLAASPNADDGFRGVAPDATLLSIRQSSRRYTLGGSSTGVGNVDTLADALVLAVRAGADVVNVSEAGCVTPAVAEDAAPPLRAALRFAADHDVVVVAAAGNVGGGGCLDGEVALPGWLGEDVLTVGALDARGGPAPFGVRGPWVDIAAPGAGLDTLGVPGGFTREPVRGTSFAAPFVAGTAALLTQQRPDASAREIVGTILATARPLPSATRDAVGSGVVDPVAALSLHPTTDAPAAGTGAAQPRPAHTPPTTQGRPTAPLPGLGERVDVEPPLPPGVAVAIVVACVAALPLAVRALRRRP
ncbi:mycosin-4 [Pseudonocardia sulfidoxydans NBRC 16205]|uniref:Mycosin-4 n=1 Tax=Pseudonocardia sulfidoxydans NBRC 16205 TaxID=1223511 RepID=A0A511DDY4_9PSEU|nr:type VII secretion-associated serine protease mycosin [Pseudonocardia sulfidoxydans]GEL22747.1 mycosin-4 [Pseudonocardia sulfidoxydans NBRC 16205]